MQKQAITFKLPFADKLSEKEKEIINRGLTHHEYEKGTYIMGFSDACLGMVYVEKGSVRVYITSKDGREITLFHISDGEYCIFSSACAIGGITLSVQMVAENNVELSAINSGAVAKLMESNIYFRCFAYELSTQKYSAVVWVMQEILFSHFDERLARLLISIYEKTGDKTIKMTQEEMAQEVNSAREVVARMLKRFASDGWIDINRGTIVLKNIQELKNILE